MIVAMQEQATEDQIQHVIERLINMGFEVHRSTGARQTVLGAVGAPHEFDIRDIEVLPGELIRCASPSPANTSIPRIRKSGRAPTVPNTGLIAPVERGGP